MTDVIQRTKKQWHAEKAEKLRSVVTKLANLRVPYVVDKGKDRKQIMELLTETLSDRQSKLLQHLEVRYGLDTRQTVARMLSEFTAAMTDGRSTAVPMTTYETISANLQTAGVKAEVDRQHVMAWCATVAHGGNLDWRVVQLPNGRIRVGVKPLPSPDSNTQKKGKE